MKKIFLLFVATLALTSCTEDIRDNNPSFEGLRNGSRWRAPGVTATLDVDGGLTISGGNQFETLTLHTPSTEVQTYVLGNSNARTATFVVTGDNAAVFSTGVGRGDGEIVITEYDEVKNLVTGTFRFNAIDEEALDPQEPTAAETINFIQGHFYKVPVYPSL